MRNTYPNHKLSGEHEPPAQDQDSHPEYSARHRGPQHWHDWTRKPGITHIVSSGCQRQQLQKHREEEKQNQNARGANKSPHAKYPPGSHVQGDRKAVREHPARHLGLLPPLMLVPMTVFHAGTRMPAGT